MVSVNGRDEYVNWLTWTDGYTGVHVDPVASGESLLSHRPQAGRRKRLVEALGIAVNVGVIDSEQSQVC